MLDERRRTEERNAGEIMVDCDLHEILGWGECGGTRIPEYARRGVCRCQRLGKCDDVNIDKNTRRNFRVGIH